jgi:DNA primase
VIYCVIKALVITFFIRDSGTIRKMSDQVDEVKSKTDIVSIIGEHVSLKKAGRNYKGFCPFHNEKTPSFNVSPELQIYKCFGCGVSGDVISFLQEYEGMEFYEALKTLADKAGVKLKPLSGKREVGVKERIYEINSWVADFYHYILVNHASGKNALKYLQKDRGIKKNSIKSFRLGFCPDVPFALKHFAVDKKRVAIDELQKAGIVYSGRGQIVDRFKGRVIFPLFDHRGSTIAFAGRAMPGRDDIAKYINSPETPVYHKSRVLYGLNLVRSEIKRLNQVVVVEGELDMISCWQAGVKNVVAIKGSALTAEQAQLLSRYTQNAVLALDADLAGDVAARRGIEIAEKEGLEVKVAVIKNYKDPDELARNNPVALKKTIADAVGVWDFIVDSVFSRYDVESGLGKAKISKEIVPILSAIRDPIVQAHYCNVVARRLNVPMEAVTSQLRTPSQNYIQIDTVEKKGKERRELLEERLLACAFQSNVEMLLEARVQKLLTTNTTQRIVKEYKSYRGKNKSFTLAEFAKSLPAELSGAFSDMVLKEIDGVDSDKLTTYEKEFKTVLYELNTLDLRNKRSEVVAKMKKYEAEGKNKKLLEVNEEFKKISKTLKELEEENNKGIIL